MRLIALIIVLALILASLQSSAGAPESYSYNHTFKEDGYFKYYYVERDNASYNAEVHLTYYPDNNSLNVVESNVRNLTLYVDEILKEFSNFVKRYYMDYLRSKGKLYLNITGDGHDKIVLMNIPEVAKVYIDEQNFEGFIVEENKVIIELNLSSHSIILFFSSKEGAFDSFVYYVIAGVIVFVAVLIVMGIVKRR